MDLCPVRRPIWSLGSKMDSGDVHFTKDRCWISKDDGKEVDMIRSGAVFLVAARPSEPSSREARTQELNPMTAPEAEQAALARGTLRLDGDGEPTVRIRVPTGPATHSAEEREREREHCMRLRDTCFTAVGVNDALRRERRTSRV